MTPIVMSNAQNWCSRTPSPLTAARVRMADQRQKALQRTYDSERYEDPKDSDAAKARLLSRIPEGARHIELVHLEPRWKRDACGQHLARWVA